MPLNFRSPKRLVVSFSIIATTFAAPAAFAATITGWNADNVAVDTSNTPGECH